MNTGGLATPRFSTVNDYGASLTDAGIWERSIRMVLDRHGLGPGRDIRAGVAGTFPTMLVGEHLVVKFFGPLFNGYDCARIEHAMYDLLAGDPEIPAPRLLATGDLGGGDGGRWAYIVSTQLPGASYLTVRDRLQADNQRAIASFIADAARRIHVLSWAVGSDPKLSGREWNAFLKHQVETCAERHRAWGTLPERLCDQIASYLDPVSDLMGREGHGAVLHGDLTADHILGEWQGETWKPTGIIDFGDAKVGDRAYELVALHIECFGGDKGLLRAFLDRYGWMTGHPSDFAREAMRMTLLHEFDVLETMFARYPDAREAPNLDALAALLWNVGM